MLANPSHNIRKDRRTSSLEYDELGLLDMKNMTRSLGDMMKLGAHELVFSSSLRFSLWHKALVPQWTEKCTSMDEDVDNSESEDEECEQVKKQTLSKVTTTALHYNRAVGKYQQTTAAKRASHTSVVEMAIHFWHSARHGVSSLVIQSTEGTGGYLEITHGGQTR